MVTFLYQNAFANAESKYSTAHGALEDLTARCFITLFKHKAAAFVLSMFKINAASWCSRRLHNVYTAFPATAQRAPRSTFLTVVKTL